jgi:hypothetical protein
MKNQEKSEGNLKKHGRQAVCLFLAACSRQARWSIWTHGAHNVQRINSSLISKKLMDTYVIKKKRQLSLTSLTTNTIHDAYQNLGIFITFFNE